MRIVRHVVCEHRETCKASDPTKTSESIKTSGPRKTREQIKTSEYGVTSSNTRCFALQTL